MDGQTVYVTVMTGSLYHSRIIISTYDTMKIDPGDTPEHQGDGSRGNKPFDLQGKVFTVILPVYGTPPGSVYLIRFYYTITGSSV